MTLSKGGRGWEGRGHLPKILTFKNLDNFFWDTPTDRQTDRQTDNVVHWEVTLPKRQLKHDGKPSHPACLNLSAYSI